MQQLLPFTVLKRHLPGYAQLLSRVATALTVYGIETDNVVKESDAVIWLQQLLPFTVLKLVIMTFIWSVAMIVATALTVYGIETICTIQFLVHSFLLSLQQLLPFTVLKQTNVCRRLGCDRHEVATALTVYGIETDL